MGGTGEKIVGGVQRPCIGEICCGDFRLGGAADGEKIVIGHGGAGDDRKIPGAGVVIFILEAVGVGKMRIGAAQCGGLLIHQIHKIGDGAAD